MKSLARIQAIPIHTVERLVAFALDVIGAEYKNASVSQGGINGGVKIVVAKMTIRRRHCRLK